MSCNYCWNQPKKYEKYDLYLDGKIKADDFVYKTKDESGEIISIKLSEKFEELENRLETHFTFDNSYKTYNELEVAFANRMLKESVIYIVKNETTSDNPDIRDEYNEYMIMGGKLELIGSGSYVKQQADLDKEIDARIKDVDAEENRAKGEEKRIEEKLNTEIEDRKADVDAEEKRAIEAENELSTYIKKEEEIRTSQINGLNQEAKQNRNRIEQLESKVSTEITRAIEEEKKLSERITTTDEELDNEIKNRTDEDTLIRETVTSITGYSFEKISDANSATNIDIRIKTEINRATEKENALDKKIDDTKTALQKEIDDDVKVETDRATEKENDIITKLTTITGYDYSDDVTNEGGNIHTRIVNEISDREADVNAEEERAIEEEKKLAADIERFSGNVLTFYNNIDNSISLKNFDGTVSLSSYNAGGTDLTVGQSGILESIKLACRIDRNPTSEETWAIIWRITENGEYEYLITSDSIMIDGEEHGHQHTVNGHIVYTFRNKNIKVVKGERVRISFHNKSKKDNTESFNFENCSEACLGVMPSTNGDIVFTIQGRTANYVPQFEMGVWSNINEQLLNEIDEIKTTISEEKDNLLQKFDDYTTTTELQSNYTTTTDLENSYVTFTYLQEQINVLNGTIATLEERIAALEPTPEPEPTDPETPTE